MTTAPAVYTRPTNVLLGSDPEGKDVLLPVRNAAGLSQAWQKLAVVGISGSGKSYFTAVVVEQLIQKNIRACIIDPVGIWWGLRAGANGNPDAGLKIPVYGGQHGDEDLPTPIVAAQDFATYGHSMVLDISELPMEQLQLWAAQFAEELMAPGTEPTEACLLVLEEAPVLVPQTGSFSKFNRRCKAAFAHLSRVGRNRGYGMIVITQRAAAVDKNVLTQCGSLLLLRIAAKLDRRAITEWVANNSAIAEKYAQMIPSLGELPNGEGWLWSPSWAETFTRVKIPLRKTFHPSPNIKNAEMRKDIELPSPPAVYTGSIIFRVLKILFWIGVVGLGLWLIVELIRIVLLAFFAYILWKAIAR